MTIKRYFDDVYKRAIEICYGTWEEFEKRAKQFDKTFNEPKSSGMVLDIGDGTMQILFIKKQGKGAMLAVLVHETFHLTFHILDLVDMKLTDQTQEAYAYYQEHLFRTIRKLLKI